MDGNDSLKRVRGRGPTAPDSDDGTPVMRPSNERPDNRTCGEEYFLSREVVDALSSTLEEVKIAADEVCDPARSFF